MAGADAADGAEGADADGAAAGVGCGLGGDAAGAELSPVSTSMRTEPTLTVSCTCPNMARFRGHSRSERLQVAVTYLVLLSRNTSLEDMES